MQTAYVKSQLINTKSSTVELDFRANISHVIFYTFSKVRPTARRKFFGQHCHKCKQEYIISHIKLLINLIIRLIITMPTSI